jgi:ferredoxin
VQIVEGAPVAYVINEPCIGTKDASCVEACPVDAITAEDQVPDGWRHYIQINANYYKQQKP